MPNAIHGLVVRDTGEQYSYSADWTVDGEQLNWNAVVARAGRVKGTPSGVVLAPEPEEIAWYVRHLVEGAIKGLKGVER